DNQLSETEYSSYSANNSGFMFANLSGYRGKIRYEMANHASTKLSTSLGNVLTVVSDKKLTICSSGTFVSYAAEVISATDYSPFGAPLAGRTYQVSEYRFSFNGKEKIDEINGAGNDIDFGARMYDSRLGRFLSVDPVSKEFCWNSPYIFADNCPISNVDFDGKFPLPVVYFLYEGALVAIELGGSYAVIQKIMKNVPPSLMANRNPDFDYQRSQDRIQKSKYIATQIVFKKMIDKHFNQDPNEFKDPKGRWGGKFGLVVGGLFVLDQVQSELKRMKESTQANLDASNKKITELKSKDKLSSKEQERLNKLEQQAVNYKLDLEGINGAIDETAEQIKKVKTEESRSQNPADATEYVMPNSPR
ncbi:MAG: RHS repeat-associated core domain-containing protein, partial [Bacteroidota bacterium]|nr:RHS repeat-associated core domain-containing protein [Bacteroidota bacterium]